jgi:hypothetical protein
LAALVLGLAAIAVPITAALPPALANESGGLYLSPNNASDPDMVQCSFQGVNGYCMYTSQDLNQSGNYPMSNTLGFFSTDGYSWTAEGTVLSEQAYIDQGWVPANAKHLWAPDAYQGVDGNWYLFVPDVTDVNQQHSSSFIGVSRSTNGPFGPFTPIARITNPMTDPAHNNQAWNGGYASDPDVLSVPVRGGGRWMVFANGDTSSTNCGTLSIAALDDSMTSISNSQLITINGASALGTCGSTGQPYEEGASLYYSAQWGPEVPGPFLLVFAAKPTSTPSGCAANLGQPNSANEVIAYATASSVTGPYTYKGILMCGSSTEWTNQATLMPLRTLFGNDTAIAMYYHDGPAGNHNRKVHAQCLPFGGGNFVATMRPVTAAQQPSFSSCMQDGYVDTWGLQEPSGQMVTTCISCGGGHYNGEMTDGFGRIAMGPYEQFLVDSSSGGYVPPSGYAPIYFSGTVSNVDLIAKANGKYVYSDHNVAIAEGTNPSYGGNSVNLTYNGATGGENVTLTINNKSTYVNGTGDLSTDGATSTTFNVIHYYNRNSVYYPSNLAAGRPTAESSQNSGFGSSNATDGDQNTYWESTNNVFPDWVQVDLGSIQTARGLELQLPSGWGARDQTLSVLGSTDGVNFSTVTPSATYTFSPATNNTVVIPLRLCCSSAQRYWRVQVSANTGWPAGQVAELRVLSLYNGFGPWSISSFMPTTESSENSGFGSSNVTDLNQDTYWESANYVFPDWVQVDLGTTQTADEIVLQLPAGWGARDQTLEISTSDDGVHYGLVTSGTYTFSPASNNTVTIPLPGNTGRYWRVTVSANTGWPAGQIAEFEVINQ